MANRTLLAFALMMIAVPHATHAQEPEYFQSTDAMITSVFRAEPSVLVEAVGLNQWTLQRVQQSLDSAGVPLFADRRNWGTLRSAPGFPQSVIYQSRGDSAVTVFLALIEPQDSVYLTVRNFSGDSTSSIAPWSVLVELSRVPFRVFEAGILASIHARAAGLEPRLSMTTRADSAVLTGVWSALAVHRTGADAIAAKRTLTTSPNTYDRLAALAILSNFDGEDGAWHALVGTLLDPNEIVRDYARSILRAFTANFPRRVDWVPAAPELHALLQGSDLFSLSEMLDMLVVTGIGPEAAGPLLSDGGHAVLMFAGAQNAWARGPAHRFLRAISGKRAAATPAEWRAWIDTL